MSLQQEVRDKPWVLGGDFNVIASLDEYAGSSMPELGAISYFTDFLASTDLQEFPTTGGIFTWTGVRLSVNYHFPIE